MNAIIIFYLCVASRWVKSQPIEYFVTLFFKKGQYSNLLQKDKNE